MICIDLKINTIKFSTSTEESDAYYKEKIKLVVHIAIN